MFQLTVLVSSSQGNASFIRTDETAILLDAGAPAKTIFNALEDLRIDRHEIKGLVISHEHSDHIKGAGAVLRNLKVPLYINEETYYQCQSRLGNIPAEVKFFQTGTPFQINDLIIHPFSSSHDAVESCNFTFHCLQYQERKLGIATDLGFPTTLVINRLKNCTTIVLESNHDEKMLMNGPYPWRLKQRIKSSQGHLSNQQAVGLLSQIVHYGLENLILAHLSETNNNPKLACETMNDYLQSIRSNVNIFIADPCLHTPLINI
ncbi:MAG: MBL fold metallo-hydrolase [Candidatus Cloacimonadaceae bacterium]|jgi:phosphoribosyl 1,2-cyclic phosphodiesterase|nr:MBL fold metallo-hydrolase [Candidatus Cloacimonadota bacterium]MDY0111640.1 MBL fold metallo-hydrolase [Candidatus Syntrophosphaera sp.]